MTMVVKDGASVETQWLTQSTAIKNHGGEREKFLFECSIKGFRFLVLHSIKGGQFCKE